MAIIYSVPLLLLFVLVLIPCMLLGLSGVWLTRRNNWMLDADDNEIISLTHAFAGVLYAVALGLMVVNVQSDYTEVEMVVMKEASLAEDLYIDSEGLRGSASNEIQQLVIDYVDTVVDEWETISQDNILELPSHEAVDDLAYRIIEYEPQGDKELIIYAEMLGGINEMLDYRRERLHLGVDGVGPVTWIVVAMGALITIGMAWFYNGDVPTAVEIRRRLG